MMNRVQAKTLAFTKEPFIEVEGNRRIAQWQFSAMSQSEISKMAATQICLARYYDGNRKPTKGGLLDARLGPANKQCGDCETCGAKLSDCPGHFGYFVLAVPVFNVGYLSTVVDVLKCICKSCSRMILDDKARSGFLNTVRDPRKDKSVTMKEIVKKCTSMTSNNRSVKCLKCGYMNGSVKRAQGMLAILHGAVDDFKSVIPVMKDSKASINLQPHMLNPVKVFSLFKRMLDETMDAQGNMYSELAPKRDGKNHVHGIEYRRSLPLNSVELEVPFESRPTWIASARLNAGHLKFDPYAEDGVIKNVRHYGSVFEAITLLKVNNDTDGDCNFLVTEEFYPPLHKMLKHKKDWSTDFCFRGRAVFEHGVLEWTETILTDFKSILYKAGIYGAVAVSRYPYEYCGNVWRAFCELWGPLTNTLHHAIGEMSISLYDLNIIGGLPISGKPYEEFVPPNSDLVTAELYPPTIAELLRVYSYLCDAYNSKYVYWPWWIEHFYRGPIIYGAYGDCKNSGVTKLRQPKLELRISEQGKLAAFLAFWLCRFVLPSNNKKIRPETFYMASLMAEGIRVSLAPTVLGYIYHGLGEMATHPGGPGSSNSCLPIHYVIGWLGEYFPGLYASRSDKEFPTGYPRLARYAGVPGKYMSITTARMVFRTDRSVVYRPISVACDKDRFLLDDDKLPDLLFEVLVSMRSALLPIRVGEGLFLEPYYPNRFARQFGLDQSVPSNKLSFGVSKRRQCGVEDLLKAQIILYRRDTTSRFFIPRSSRLGDCSWWYCRWWLRSCTPYLGLSVTKTFQALNQRPPPAETGCVFVVRNLREISTGLKREVKISEMKRSHKRSPRKALQENFDGNSYSKADRSHKKARNMIKSAIVVPEKSSRNGEQEFDVMVPNQDFEEMIPDQVLEEIIPDQVFNHEPAMPSVCLSDACSNEAPSMLKEYVSSLLDSELPSFKKEFVIAQIIDIHAKVSSSLAPKELSIHLPDIRSSLDMLRPAIKLLKSGRDQLEEFVCNIEKALDVVDRTLASTRILDQKDLIDTRLEECEKTKETLKSQIAESSNELKTLSAEESDIIAEEKRIQRRRSEYNAKKQSLEVSLRNLEDSLKQQEGNGQKLQEEKSAYMTEKCLEIEHATAIYKAGTEEYTSLSEFLLPLLQYRATRIEP